MTSPVTIVAGQDILAADFDAYENLTAAWTAYTPTWTTNGTAPALGNGTLTGRYLRAGLFIVAAVAFAAGSTSTFGTGDFRFSLPVANGSSASHVGSAVLLDAGTTRYSATCLVINGTSYATVVAGSTNFVSATNPITWTTSDSLDLTVIYQA